MKKLVKMSKAFKVSGIYAIYILKDSEKKILFLGSSKNLQNICSEHRCRLKNREYATNNKAILQRYYDNDVQMYFEVLEECENDMRKVRLKFYHNKFKNSICNSRVLTKDSNSVEARMRRKGLNKNVC